MFPVTITLSNAAQLAAVLAVLQPGGDPQIAVAPQTASAPAPEPVTAKAEAQAKAEPQAIAQEVQAEETNDEPISYDQVSKAIASAVTKNRQKVVDTLAKFDAKKGTELKAEQYAAFLKELAS